MILLRRSALQCRPPHPDPLSSLHAPPLQFNPPFVRSILPMLFSPFPYYLVINIMLIINVIAIVFALLNPLRPSVGKSTLAHISPYI